MTEDDRGRDLLIETLQANTAAYTKLSTVLDGHTTVSADETRAIERLVTIMETRDKERAGRLDGAIRILKTPVIAIALLIVLAASVVVLWGVKVNVPAVGISVEADDASQD